MSRSRPTRRGCRVGGLQVLACVFAFGASGAQAGEEAIRGGGIQLESVERIHIAAGAEVNLAGRPRRFTDFYLIRNRPMPRPISYRDVPPRAVVSDHLHVNTIRARVVHHDVASGAYAWIVPQSVDLAEAFFWWTTQMDASFEAWETTFWSKHSAASRSELAAMARPASGRGPDGARSSTFSAGEVASVSRTGASYEAIESLAAQVSDRMSRSLKERGYTR